jgi:HK97 gp10 family phage protein
MPIRASVTFDDHGLIDRLRAFPGAAREAAQVALRDIGDDVYAVSQRNVPVDKGTLRASGNVRVDENEVTIGYNTPYAKFVHDGTAPHVILPRNAKVLAFPPSGARGAIRGGKRVGIFTFSGKSQIVGLVYAKEVHHPGTRAQPFLADAMEETRPRWLEHIRRRIRNAWKALGGK